MSGQAPSEHSHGSVKSYVIGLILSIVLTIIPFGVVMAGSFELDATLAIIVATAVAQVLVQLILFMHMSTKTDEGWNFNAFVFTVLILVLVIGGSVWIMYHLHLNMMIG
ncbi:MULTISPECIES: cytochrome o ubiquinol oxidase subunit IV [Halomonas]|jgi:cytochrome o ubiquinol oxidase subunit IV|uniref:Cytochrome bo(3) ubiquinol oxidase subunit 4 n=1 Tax=Halomonas binhaiensis TaxID=2562282 RepID=A0A5C1NGT1_9GAMM|nr:MULTISPECIES: cytochrome o ubiquinol oxidase subunit IV [Halomonas]QEM82466.1 cytochrome o ubiquinol oxidase subunit IV [Halomonas binhaiensis]